MIERLDGLTRLPLIPNGHQIGHNGTALVSKIDGITPIVIDMASQNCDVCDTYLRFRITDGAVEAVDPCPHPDGITTEVSLNVPSGKLLVSDNLRPVYSWDHSRSASASYNTVLGQSQVVHAMAAIGCAFGPVGNSSPGLYQTGTDTYVIATYDEPEANEQSLPEATRLATICTDIWAYSMADLEHWKSRGGDPSALDPTDTVVEVPPGAYRFIHHTGKRGFDHYKEGAVIFADITRISTHN